MSPHRLTSADPIAAPDAVRRAVQRDYARFALSGLPEQLEIYLLDEYGLDVSAEYAGMPLTNPWGKASGQLSMTARQVEEDVAAGLGFVVLKTLIAQDERGEQSMSAWAIQEARMVAERIVGQSGESGWTITWKGRGWWQSLEAYLQLIRDARQIATGTQTLIVPSCKYHLPSTDEPEWRRREYEFTTRKILEAWRSESNEAVSGKALAAGIARTLSPAASAVPLNENAVLMPLEKDFSPTLAGSDLASARTKILEWLRVVPRLVREAAGDRLRIGLKMFNALFDDAFQVEMLHVIHDVGADRPDFFVHANRLFDPAREFDGQRGVAFGGPDLSDRNLRVLDRFLAEHQGSPLLPWSATGNITTGRMAVEYALRGATSFQLHTFFQLPADQYSMKTGNRTQRALHELYFHPTDGFIVWLHDVANRRGIETAPFQFRGFASVGQVFNHPENIKDIWGYRRTRKKTR